MPGSRRLAAIYPALLVVAYVLNVWADAAVSPYAVLRALAIGVLGTLALTGLSAAVLRSWHRGALAATLLLLALSAEPTRALRLVLRLEGWQALVLLGLVALLLVWLAWLAARLVRRSGWPSETRGMTVLSAAFLLAVVGSAVSRGALTPADWAHGRGETGSGAEAESERISPDVFVFLLDGYPRADTLADLYGFDNTAFESALEQRGFEVAQRSTSNYMFTQLTLSSMFHMRPVAELELPPAESSMREINLRLRETMNRNPAFELLRERGYQVVATAPGWETVSLRQADVFLDGGQANELERHLLRRTHLMDLLDVVARGWLADQQRERIHATFELASDVAKADGRRWFVFAHLPVPHPPHVFAADGSPTPDRPMRALFADTPSEAGQSTDEFVAEMRGQIAYTNRLMLAAVDAILEAASGPPVIVVMSDHGTRTHVTYGDPDDPDIGERFRSFFAAYTPGHDGLFGDDVTPIQVLPILFNAYLGTQIECRTLGHHANGPISLLDLVEIDIGEETGSACEGVED